MPRRTSNSAPPDGSGTPSHARRLPMSHAPPARAAAAPNEAKRAAPCAAGLPTNGSATLSVRDVTPPEDPLKPRQPTARIGHAQQAEYQHRQADETRERRGDGQRLADGARRKGLAGDDRIALPELGPGDGAGALDEGRRRHVHERAPRHPGVGDQRKELVAVARPPRARIQTQERPGEAIVRHRPALPARRASSRGGSRAWPAGPTRQTTSACTGAGDRRPAAARSTSPLPAS